jgi:hypothetical protein
MTYGPDFLRLPLVCFELEPRDVEVGLFSNSDLVYDPPSQQRQTCHLRTVHWTVSCLVSGSCGLGR